MLMPKRVKFRRMQRGRMTGKATRENSDEDEFDYSDFELEDEDI